MLTDLTKQLWQRFVLARNTAALWLVSFCLCASLPAQIRIVVGGNYTSNITTALNAQNLGFVNATGFMTPDPTLYDLAAGDVIIISNDGGYGPFVDYRDFLAAGGHLIVMGGSNDQGYRDWVALYFTLTDTASGWHTDGAWETVETGHAATQGLPATYAFENNLATYHMLAFLPAADTVLYGRNTEPNFIAAIRTYSGGGTFNYMALDIGRSDYTSTADYNSFVVPWLTAALQIAAVPEPSTWAMLGLGLLVVAWQLRRRQR